VPDRKHDAI